jgi:transposase
MYEKIQNFKKLGLFKNEIAEKLKCNPRTVRKYFNMTKEEYQKYKDSLSNRNKLLEAYKDEIIDIFRSIGNKSLQATSVYDLLIERHGEIPGSEKTMRNFINYLIESGSLLVNKSSRVHSPVKELPMGLQMQIDFGEHRQINGKKIYVLGCVLSASRYKYAYIQFRPFTTADLILSLCKCFNSIGGMPEELVIDQDHLMVVSENSGDLIYTEKFRQFLDETKLKMWVCRKSDPASKGRIENSIKYIKHNFLYTRSFEEEEEANISLRKWLTRRANGKVCQATRKIPSILFLEEKKFLKPFNAGLYLFEQVNLEVRTVNQKLKTIMVDTVKYPVPENYYEKEVFIDRKSDHFNILCAKTKNNIGCFNYLSIKGGIHKDCYRKRGSENLDELEKEIISWSELSEWKKFVEICRKTYKKYFRDQITVARRNIRNSVNNINFKEALMVCLELKTYSMKDLSDTFNHLAVIQKHEEIKEIKPLNCKTKISYPVILVATRGIKEYINMHSSERSC